MKRRFGVLLALVLCPSCRGYDYASRLSANDGLVPGDQYAHYGREQAQSIAIARRFAQAGAGGMDTIVAYARGLPDVVHATADSQANWLTLSFRSGWRVAVTPLADGESAAETPNLPTAR